MKERALSACLIALMLALASPFASADIERIYVVVLSHLDIGFTGSPQLVALGYKRNIDNAIFVCEREPDFKWTIETSWQLWQWLLRTRDRGQIERLRRLVLQGRISVGALPATMLSGLLGSEEVCRLPYLTWRLCRRLGIPFPKTAIQDDVPGYTDAYPQILSDAGVRYFLSGVNLFVGGGVKIPRREMPFLWQGRGGGPLLTWISEGYCEGNRWGIGIFSKWDRLEEDFLSNLRELERRGYPYEVVLVMASVGDNVDARHARGVLERVRRWNAKGRRPKVVIATPEDFFQEIERRYKGRFPTYRGDWSGAWAPYVMRAPYGRALIREAHELLPAAETLSSLLSMVSDFPYPNHDLERGWEACIEFDDHSGCTAGWPRMMTEEQVRINNWQALRMARVAYEAGRNTLEFGLSFLAEQMVADRDGVLVLNPLPFGRREAVLWRIHYRRASEGFDLVDPETGRAVPLERLSEHKAIFVADLPPFGYRRFEVRNTRPLRIKRVVEHPAGQPACIENEFFRVTVSPEGRVVSILDKVVGRELVDRRSPYEFCGLVYGSNRQLFLGGAKPIPLKGSVRFESGAVLRRIIIERKGTPFFRTEIRLYRRLK
ncbi:MAG TPA: hypothetical protein EYP65_04375, partial [Armatimonadetes bacterium]|nr:hypothetical protein [Armatimonadota bacterium]